MLCKSIMSVSFDNTYFPRNSYQGFRHGFTGKRESGFKKFYSDNPYCLPSVRSIIAPASTLSKFDCLIQACEALSKRRSLPCGKAFWNDYNQQVQFPELFSDVALILALNSFWGYLWLRKKHWIQGKNKFSLPSIIAPYS